MLFVALFSESSASLPVLLLIFWQLLLIELLEYFKTSGSSQAAVLDISEAFYRAWHISHGNSVKRLFIVLKYTLPSECAINARIPQNCCDKSDALSHDKLTVVLSAQIAILHSKSSKGRIPRLMAHVEDYSCF